MVHRLFCLGPGCMLIFALAAGTLVPVSRAWAGQAAAGPLVFAGSGTNITAPRILAQAFARKHPEIRIEIPGSIDSTGGIRAAADGAITLGLISRSLKKDEKALGLTVLPYARTATVLAVHPTVPDTGLGSEDLVQIYQGTLMRWSDGSEIVVLTRDPDDSAIEIFARGVPGFLEAYQASHRAKRWTTLYTAQEMNRALVRTPHALGITDLGTVTAERLPVKVLKLNGIFPSGETVRAGRYPLFRTLAFVFLPDRLPPEARAFVEFARSEEGQRIVRASGYLPGE